MQAVQKRLFPVNLLIDDSALLCMPELPNTIHSYRGLVST